MKLVGVSKKIGEKTVINDFNNTFEVGKSYAIIGDSEMQKTTLLNIMALMESADTGVMILLNDLVVDLTKQNQLHLINGRISYLFDEFSLVKKASVFENLLLDLLGFPNDEKRQRISLSLQQVELEGFENKLGSELTRIEALQVSFARILLKPFEILLIDDICDNLDEFEIKEFFKRINELKKQEKTIIMFTKDKKYSGYCDELIYL